MIGAYRDRLLPALAHGLATLVVTGAMSLKPTRRRDGFEIDEWAVLGVLALAPLMALVVSSIVKGGYFTRYSVWAYVPMPIGAARVNFTMVGPEYPPMPLLPTRAVACFGGYSCGSLYRRIAGVRERSLHRHCSPTLCR